MKRLLSINIWKRAFLIIIFPTFLVSCGGGGGGGGNGGDDGGETPIRAGYEPAALSISPKTANYQTADTFDVEVLLDTGGEKVVAVSAYVKYDSTCFLANSIDVSDSVFTSETERMIDSANGLIKITRGVTPGITVYNGKVASINFTALSHVAPISDNFVLEFKRGATNESNVIRDDCSATGKDILGTVHNGRISVQ